MNGLESDRKTGNLGYQQATVMELAPLKKDPDPTGPENTKRKSWNPVSAQGQEREARCRGKKTKKTSLVPGGKEGHRKLPKNFGPPARCPWAAQHSRGKKTAVPHGKKETKKNTHDVPGLESGLQAWRVFATGQACFRKNKTHNKQRARATLPRKTRSHLGRHCHEVREKGLKKDPEGDRPKKNSSREDRPAVRRP